MLARGLLLCTAPLPRLRRRLRPMLAQCAAVVSTRLTVAIQHPSAARPTDALRQFLHEFYAAAAQCPVHDVRFLLPNAPFADAAGRSDVVLGDCDQRAAQQSLGISRLATEFLQLSVADSDELPDDAPVATDNALRTYDYVCVGGTFDYLHIGHKLLLSQCALITDRTLLVGITDHSMHEHKLCRELMQPYAAREAAVREFLETIKPGLQLQLVPIADPFGPSITESNLKAVVVTSETLKGGQRINELRAAKGMSPLSVECCDVINSVATDGKISSTEIRRSLLGELWRAPPPPAAGRARPYVVGLTGGIATGKTHIADYMASKGVTVLNCDRLGHDSYALGTETYRAVIEAFGASIVDSAGHIDRRRLGHLVFANRACLDQLNSIIWPVIYRQAQQFIAAQRCQFVVLEAALLFEANWCDLVDEVWVSIVSPSEAVERIMVRDHLSAADAQARLAYQWTNEQRVARANVIICTHWEYEYTERQIDKAWHGLRQRLGLANTT